MNNLHRELAPVSEGAWAQIEAEAARTLKRYRAGRSVVDLKGPGGTGLSAVGTGHLRKVEPPADGILARQREVKPLVELRVPFELERQAIDDVDRGANDSDWQPLKDAAKRIAFAEDRAIFEGYAAAGIEGVRQGTSNPLMTLPADITDYPNAIAQAVSRGLDRLSRETGGLIFPNPGHRTSEVFSKIESDLRNMYVLGFAPPSDARDGKFHALTVTTARPGLVVRSRAGYWAPLTN